MSPNTVLCPDALELSESATMAVPNMQLNTDTSLVQEKASPPVATLMPNVSRLEVELRMVLLCKTRIRTNEMNQMNLNERRNLGLYLLRTNTNKQEG